MSVANIVKENVTPAGRSDGYFKTLSAQTINLELGCQAPEVSIRELKLRSDDNFITTLSTVALENYPVIFPAFQADENSLVTINANGELNFLPSSSLPTIGGDIVCNSVQSATFVNSSEINTGGIAATGVSADTLTITDEALIDKIECGTFKLDGLAGGKTELKCQDENNFTADSIQLPSTTVAPEVDMCLTIEDVVDSGGNGYAVGTRWAFPKRAFAGGTPFFLPVNSGITYLTKTTQFPIASEQLGTLGLQAGKSYRLLITEIQVRKESGGTNQDYFIVEAGTVTEDAFNLTKEVAICGMGNGSDATNYQLINQKDITQLVNTGSANNAGAYTRPIQLILQNILETDTLSIQIGNGYFGANGWNSWSIPASIEGVFYEL